MTSEGDPLRSCVAQLSRFPGIGERTATRLVYWLLRQQPEVAAQIGEALAELCIAALRDGHQVEALRRHRESSECVAETGGETIDASETRAHVQSFSG